MSDSSITISSSWRLVISPLLFSAFSWKDGVRALSGYENLVLIFMPVYFSGVAVYFPQQNRCTRQ